MALAIYLSTFLVAIICALFIKWLLNHNQRLPPGPVGVPVLGYLPFLDVFHLGQSFSKLSKRFGEIFSLRVGTELAIVLNSYESIKKAFSKAELIDRPDTFMFRFFSQGENGIASASGEKWRVQRKFTHTQLKKFGFGRPQMEPFVQDAVRNLISTLKEKSGGGANPVEIGFDINVAVVNVIWSIITGESKSQNDPRIKEFLIAVNKGVELASTSGILLFMPFLAKIFPEKRSSDEEIKTKDQVFLESQQAMICMIAKLSKNGPPNGGNERVEPTENPRSDTVQTRSKPSDTAITSDLLLFYRN